MFLCLKVAEQILCHSVSFCEFRVKIVSRRYRRRAQNFRFLYQKGCTQNTQNDTEFCFANTLMTEVHKNR